MILRILSTYGILLLKAMGQTLLLALCGLFFACILGLIFGLLSVLKSRVCNAISTIFVDVIRGVPMIVLAFMIYFGVPQAINGLISGARFTLTALQAGTVALALNCGAYMAEIIRSGIAAVDWGQTEAARSLGFNRMEAMRFVVLPQAIKNILPAIGNEMIALLKETAVAGYVAVQDLTRAANLIRNNTYDAVNPLLVTALVYLTLVVLMTALLQKFEQRLRRSDKR